MLLRNPNSLAFTCIECQGLSSKVLNPNTSIEYKASVIYLLTCHNSQIYQIILTLVLIKLTLILDLISFSLNPIYSVIVCVEHITLWEMLLCYIPEITIRGYLDFLVIRSSDNRKGKLMTLGLFSFIGYYWVTYIAYYVKRQPPRQYLSLSKG